MQSANQFFLKHTRRAEVLAVNGVKLDGGSHGSHSLLK